MTFTSGIKITFFYKEGNLIIKDNDKFEITSENSKIYMGSFSNLDSYIISCNVFSAFNLQIFNGKERLAIKINDFERYSCNDLIRVYQEIRDKHYDVEYYASGNVKSKGELTSENYKGLYFEYYDTSEKKIKLIRNFFKNNICEDTSYHSLDGLITLLVSHHDEETDKISSKIYLNQKINNINFNTFKFFDSSDDNYCYNVLKITLPNEYYKIIQQKKFDALPLESRISNLFEENYLLKEEIRKMKNVSKGSYLCKFRER